MIEEPFILIPIKNKTKILKYHILDTNEQIYKYKICNIYSQFGREITFQNSNQHRLNICYSKDDILKIKHLDLINIIKKFENYFKIFEEVKDYELISNIIDRDIYGIVIRMHLKTNRGKTITPLKKIINNEILLVEWIQFDKKIKFNIEFHPDCLWIDNINKKFGVSFIIDNVFQN